MTSLKKLIAVVAAALPLAASAQQAAAAAAPAPLYQWYGTLNLNTHYFEVSKPFKASATATPVNITGRFVVSPDSSNIGIRGTADTGVMGLGVTYQCETSANLDGVTANVNPVTGGVAAGGTVSTGPGVPANASPVATALQVVCNRNSRLGITSDWGTLFYGNWDSPYKAVWYGTKGDDAFGNTDVFDAASLMGSPGFRTKSTAGVTTLGFFPVGGVNTYQTDRSFNIRAANSIVYHSPKVFGAQAKLQVSPNENAANDGKIAPMLWSAALNYDQGPLSVFAAYERHDDWSGMTNIAGTAAANGQPLIPGGTATSVDQGVRVGAGYELGTAFGTTTVGAVWEQLWFDFANPGQPAMQALVGGPTGAVGTTPRYYTRQAAMGNLKHRTGNHEFRFRYVYADNGDCKVLAANTKCNFDIGKGAQNYTVGYAFYLSKAAQAYAYWTLINNERTATYTFATAGANSVTNGFGGGGDPMAAGLGLRYAF
jgi:predicted porin